jgi:adenylyl cyclase-associated protein
MVDTAPPVAISATPKKFVAVKAPPKLALEGNKWVIVSNFIIHQCLNFQENYSKDNAIVIDKAELKHVVYIYNCEGSTIQIKGKVNAITIGNYS